MSHPLHKIQAYASILQQVMRPRHISLAHYPPTARAATEKHCILLHGWGESGACMTAWMDALKSTSIGREFHFWLPTYDTSWRTFPQSARAMKVLLSRTSYDFNHTLILGHSMGGLVGREMACAGFPLRHLIALCTPHHGAAPWIPLLWRRTYTLKSGSRMLRDLNNNGDISHRSHYHFWGVTYTDAGGTHQHDGIVEIASALGTGIAGNIDRRTFTLAYKTPIYGLNLSAPHIHALNPKRLPQAALLMQKLMEKN